MHCKTERGHGKKPQSWWVGQSEPHAARMGELLPSRHRQQGVSGTRFRRRLQFKHKTKRRKGGTYPLSHLYGHFVHSVLPESLVFGNFSVHGRGRMDSLLKVHI
jgi:hypothetical protein